MLEHTQGQSQDIQGYRGGMPGADMGRDKTAEYAGPRRQCLQRDFPQGFVVVHEEQ
jgi:hypothetical protein